MHLDLQKKVGPFSIGVWLILIAVGGGIGWYFTRGSFTSPPDDAEDLGGQDGATGDQIGDGPGGWSLIPPVQGEPTPPTNVGMTLAEWERKALKALDSRTKTNPLLAQSALHRYVNSEPLSEKQVAVIKLAHQLVGPPPVYLPIKRQTKNPPPQPNPPPRPDPSPKPGTGKWYQIKQGDTLDKIANRMYDNPQKRRLDIFHANQKGADRPGPTPGFMDRPNDLPPGHWLWIPGPTKIVAHPFPVSS